MPIPSNDGLSVLKGGHLKGSTACRDRVVGREQIRIV